MRISELTPSNYCPKLSMDPITLDELQFVFITSFTIFDGEIISEKMDNEGH